MKSRFTEEQIIYALRLADSERRELAAWMQERFKISVQRSCRLALLRRSVWYAKSTARDQSTLCQCIRDIAMNRPRFGYLRVLVMLKREGWQVGKNACIGCTAKEGLQLRMKVKRRKAHRLTARQASGIHRSEPA